MNVEKLMNRQAVACSPNDSLAQAAGQMWRHDIGCVPVVDASQRPVGMITDRDICMAALHSGRPLGELQVASAMAREVRTCRTSDPVQSAEELMARHQIRRLPVVDGSGKLAGVLSVNDLTRASATAGRAGDGVETKEVAKTLAAIGQPRAQQGRASA